MDTEIIEVQVQPWKLFWVFFIYRPAEGLYSFGTKAQALFYSLIEDKEKDQGWRSVRRMNSSKWKALHDNTFLPYLLPNQAVEDGA